jgi:hypothetical protein
MKVEVKTVEEWKSATKNVLGQLVAGAVTNKKSIRGALTVTAVESTGSNQQFVCPKSRLKLRPGKL